MSELRVVLDQIVAPVPGGIGRYTVELARALLETAPAGWTVSGMVAASPESDYRRLADLLPGLARLDKNALAARELGAAWSAGLAKPRPFGAIHAPGLMAPLFAHDRVHAPGTQIAVTIHDVVPWTHPETLSRWGAHWHRAMAKRAVRFADAIVVPTDTVAAELDELFGVAERIRVVGGAVSGDLRLGEDADDRAARLELPEHYLLAVGSLEPRKALGALVRALALTEHDIPLLVVGGGGWGGVDLATSAAEAELPEGRVRVLSGIDDADLAVLYARAAALVFPSLAEGFGLPVLEAFSLGTPVIHSDAPAVVEVAGEAGLQVPREDSEGYPRRLADAIDRLLDDAVLADRLGQLGRDRARAYSWQDSAQRVWGIHVDLAR